MAKIRKIASIEKGIEEVLKILNEDEIQNAIGKGASFLRKCGSGYRNPPNHRNPITLLQLWRVRVVGFYNPVVYPGPS